MQIKSGMSLFHGSYCVVSSPDLSQCKQGWDFGCGFYLTMDKRQAVNFIKTSCRKQYGITGEIHGLISIYKTRELDGFDVCIFNDADIDWLNVVTAFRKYGSDSEVVKRYNHHDIISGKIANDKTNVVIQAYLGGLYGEVGSERAARFAISLLKPEVLTDQVCFKTEKSLSRLDFIKSEEYVANV